MNNEKNLSSLEYQNFLKENPKEGYLKIRAYAASGAIPIKGLKIQVNKNIENDNIIFFEGETDRSGIIERIALPAPTLNESDLIKPNYITYNIKATYDGIDTNYKVNIYENIIVVQTINVTPDMSKMGGI